MKYGTFGIIFISFWHAISALGEEAQSSCLAPYSTRSTSCIPRKKAPFFQVKAVLDGKFIDVSLDQFKGKYLVIIFYPFDFTYVCPTELIAFSDALEKFKALKAAVVAINTESIYTHLAWTKTARNQGGVQGLRIPLLSDFGKNVARAYGVLVEDETDIYYGASLRGLFIIDGNGVVRSTTINDAAVGRSVDETLRLIQAFQHTDIHGDVCPANWKPGEATITPDQDKKREYFENAFNTEKIDF